MKGTSPTGSGTIPTRTQARLRRALWTELRLMAVFMGVAVVLVGSSVEVIRPRLECLRIGHALSAERARTHQWRYEHRKLLSEGASADLLDPTSDALFAFSHLDKDISRPDTGFDVMRSPTAAHAGSTRR